MLIDVLKEDNIKALKSRNSNARAILSVVINKCNLLEIEKKRKDETLTDADIINIILKTNKELDEEISNFEKVNNSERILLLKEQKSYLEIYLPKMLTKEEILSEINSLDDKSIGSIMQYFKNNFSGKVDMREVSTLAREYKE